MTEQAAPPKEQLYNGVLPMPQQDKPFFVADPKPGGPSRGADGKFEAKKDTNPATPPSDDEILDKLMGKTNPVAEPEKPQETPEEPKGETPPEKPQVTAPSKRSLEKAAKALELDGWTEEDIDELPPEKLVRLGKQAGERQAKIAKELEARSQNGEAGRREQDGARAAKAEPGGQLSTDALKSKLKPITDVLGEEAGAALMELFNNQTGTYQQRIDALEARIGQLMEARGEDVGRDTRQQLSERFPELTDDETFDEIVDEMAQLGSIKGRWKDMGQLMEAACRLKGLEEKRASTPKSPRVPGSKRDASLPTTPSKAPSNDKPLTHAEREDRALDAALSGASRDEIQRSYWGR